MESLLYFLLVVFVVIIFSAILFFTTRSPARRETDAAADYAAGLNYLVSGESGLALEKLKDAVRKNTENVDAYLKIGDLLRESGHVDQAIKIHRDLTARTSLSLAQQLLILRSLEADFECKNAYDSALKIIEKIYELKKDDLWAREKELQIHEAKKDWEQAEAVYRKLIRQKNKSDESKLASYRVEVGRQLMNAQKAKEAREAFRQAIKTDKKYFPAYLELSENYVAEDRPADALNVLKKFVQANPDDAANAFGKIGELLFTIGEFGEIENVYSQVISNSPENWDAYLALADIKDKKGEIEAAIELCQQILQKNPDYQKARGYLVRYYHRQGNDGFAVEQALALINTLNEHK
jgi:lipopolysaccharide biosynthesis regulator YciM